MGNISIDVITAQSEKSKKRVCGDVIHFERNVESTLLLCADGLGSGIKANIAATLTASRLSTLLKLGFSIKNAYARLEETMNDARINGLPFAAFTVVRILPNGITTLYSYEMPPFIILRSGRCETLSGRAIHGEKAKAYEANIQLKPGEGLFVVSDGITQAGMGNGYTFGWTIEGVANFMNDRLSEDVSPDELPEMIVQRADIMSRGTSGDDCSVIYARAKEEKALAVLTGPPGNNRSDEEVVLRFLSMPGKKAVCGGTTADIAARIMGKEIKPLTLPTHTKSPPLYSIDGIDLTTEGAITLNQLYNILDDAPWAFESLAEGAGDLYNLMMESDRIQFMVGAGENAVARDHFYEKRGILTRRRIIPLMVEKLKQMGKVVSVEMV